MKALEILNGIKQYVNTDQVKDKYIDEAIEEIETLQQSIKAGMINYDKLWDMYSELKKENKELKRISSERI